jgi:carbamoyltransferase
MKILGISGSTHDSSASIIVDGKIVACVEEERLSRNKHATRELPIKSSMEVMDIAGVKPEDIDYVAYFINPRKYNKEVVGHIFWGDPQRYLLHPVKYRTINFLKRGIRYKKEALSTIKSLGLKAPIVWVDHHMAHAASSFLLSPFNEAMVVTIDNMGELDSTMLAYGKGNEIKKILTQNIPHSLGMFYAVITQYLGFNPWDEEGKIMALAAYGKPTIDSGKMITFKNGKFFINKDFQMIQTLKRERLFKKVLEDKFGKSRKRDEPIEQKHKDFAASAQLAIEKTMIEVVSWLHSKTKSRNLCLAGGVVLNCKLNGELSKLPFIDNVYVTPACGDNGTSLGAATYVYTKMTKKRPEQLVEAGLGRVFSDEQIENVLKNSNLKYIKSDYVESEAANILSKENIIAWFQGGSEFGPRALGHRSILGLPQKESTRDYINREVKGRELWRPLCPSVLAESASIYFDDKSQTKFMNIACNATKIGREKIPAVIHVDNTARIQIVSEIKNKPYYKLLNELKKINGIPVVLNTSFNFRGEPIVYSPEDAIKTFNKMQIRTLIIGNFIVTKP